MKKFPADKSVKSGQMTVEMVLLLAVMMSMSYFVLNQFKTIKPVYNFISGPWKTIGGMIESGNWQQRQKAIQDKNHPNYWRRMFSQRGENPS